MFKHFLFGAAMLFSVSVYAQQNQPAAEASPKSTSPEAQQLGLADQLVQYGYQTKSALPLIQAVQIYKSLNVQPATDNLKKESEGTVSVSGNIQKTEVVSFDVPQILADATKFAEGDKNLLALIRDAEKATQGRVGGSFYRTDCVRGNDTDVWRITFRGGESARVSVCGDGDTDLDLYIYDENGNFITSDTDGLDYCVCTFNPRWTGTFYIKIKNWGRITNCYTLRTN